MSDGGSWNSEYGHFFLAWYSRQLMQHADRVLGAAAAALNRRGRPRKAMAVKEVCLTTLLPDCCLSSRQAVPCTEAAKAEQACGASACV